MPPVSPTYPGVYIEEIPSGSRTIVGVQTSITAFIGRTPSGPLNRPTDCFNYADFERHFGGRSLNYPLSYSVDDFFLNGGSHAIVIRAFHGDDKAQGDATAKFALSGAPPIQAIGPGKWGNLLTIAFDHLGLRTAGATPARAKVAVQLTGVPGDGETVTFTVTPTTPANAPAITTVYTTKAGDNAFAVAQGLADAFNNNTAASALFRAATATRGADDQHATLNLATSATDQAANGSATVAFPPAAPPSPPAQGATPAKAPTPTPAPAPVTLVPESFAGAGPAKPGAATKTITVAGTAAKDGSIAYHAPVPGQRPVTATAAFVKGDDPKAIAKKLAAAMSSKFAGPNGILKTAVVDTDGVSVVLTAAPGSAGNDLTFTLSAPPAADTAVTVTPVGDVTLSGGVDSGFDTALADAAARPYLHYGITGTDLFNVTITYSPNGKLAVTERYTNVTVVGDDSPTRIDRVINPQSLLVAVNPKKTAWDFIAYDAVTGVKIQDPGQPVSALTATGGDDSESLEPIDFLGDELERSAMYALENTDLFNLMCIPPDTRVGEDGSGGEQDAAVWAEAAEFCAKRRAMLICDPPRSWKNYAQSGQYNVISPTDVNVTTEDGGRNAAVFFPFIKKADLELDGKVEIFAPSGSVAGQFAQTDLTRGVWKAPAGLETGLEGVTEPEVKMTDDQNGQLNPLGINAIRSFPIIGTIVWGSRTLRGADVFADDYKYIPVRRLTLYIEESLYRGTKWSVFEPNDERLWSQLRLSIGTFMADLSRQGAFYGYSVMCDKSTTLQSDIDKGIVNVVVAFAPVKPAEFVVLKIAQQAGQTPG